MLTRLVIRCGFQFSPNLAFLIIYKFLNICGSSVFKLDVISHKSAASKTPPLDSPWKYWKTQMWFDLYLRCLCCDILNGCIKYNAHNLITNHPNLRNYYNHHPQSRADALNRSRSRFSWSIFFDQVFCVRFEVAGSSWKLICVLNLIFYVIWLG